MAEDINHAVSNELTSADDIPNAIDNAIPNNDINHVDSDGDNIPIDGDNIRNEGDDIPNDGDDIPNDGDDIPNDGDSISDGSNITNDGDNLPKDGDNMISDNKNIPAEIQNDTDCMDMVQNDVNVSPEIRKDNVEVTPDTCNVTNVDLILDDVNVVPTDIDDGEMTPGAVCRICYGNSEDEVLLNPCHCSGSVQYSHETCLMTWLKTGATTCEICKFPYRFQKYVKPWWSRTHPNITLWHLGWVLKELVVLDWFHFLETVFICISLVIINRMSSFDLVYQFALIGLVEFLYYTLNIFSCFFLLYYGRWARLNMKVIVLNYNDEHPIVPMGILYRGLDSYSALLQRNKRLKQVVDQINEAEGEY